LQDKGYDCVLAPGDVHAIYDKDRIVARYRFKYTKKTRLDISYPAYWDNSGAVQEDMWNLRPVKDADEIAALKKCILHTGELNVGRDVRESGRYSKLRLACSWRIEHPGLWAKYATEVFALKNIELPALRAKKPGCVPKVKLRAAFYDAYKTLPPDLDGEINEVMLLHGTAPDTILKILSGGMNERYSGGIFGHGIYFAEDSGKNDQYVTKDSSYDNMSEIHKKMFETIKHPGNLYYLFLCRVVLGVPAVTKDPCDKARECEPISGTNYLYHSLVAETGNCIARYREFIQYHGSRVYPEYLMAYQRV